MVSTQYARVREGVGLPFVDPSSHPSSHPGLLGVLFQGALRREYLAVVLSQTVLHAPSELSRVTGEEHFLVAKRCHHLVGHLGGVDGVAAGIVRQPLMAMAAPFVVGEP